MSETPSPESGDSPDLDPDDPDAEEYHAPEIEELLSQKDPTLGQRILLLLVMGTIVLGLLFVTVFSVIQLL